MSTIRSLFGKVKSKNIMFKLFLSYLGTAILAVILISSFMTYRIRKENMKDISYMTELALSNITASATNVFESANQVAYELYNNYLVKMMVNTQENVDRIRVANYIKALTLTNPYIFSVYVCDKDSIVFSISNDSSFDDDFKFLKEFANKSSLLAPLPRTARNQKGETINLYSVLFHEGNPGDDNFNSFVMINISAPYLYDHIYSSSIRPGQNILLVDKEGEVLLHNDMSFFRKNISAEPFYINAKNSLAASGYFTLKSEDKTPLIYHYISDKQKKYLVLMSSEYKDFFRQVTRMQITIFMATGIVFMVIAFILVILSKKLFTPINNVFQNISSLFKNTAYQDKPITEVSLISQAFTGLIAKLNNLENDNINNLKLQQNNYLKTIFTTHGKLSDANILERMQRLSIPLNAEEPNRIVVLRTDNFKQFSESNTKDAIDFQLSSIGNIAAETLKPEYESIAVEVYPEIVVLIVKSPMGKEQTHTDNRLADLLKKCQNSIQQLLSISVTIGISDCSRGINRLRERYMQAYGFTHYRLIYGRQSIIHDDNLTINDSTTEKLGSIADSAVNALKKGDLDAYQTSIKSFFHALKCSNYDNIVKHFLKLATSILHIPAELKTNDLSNTEYDIEEICMKIKSFESYEELEGWYVDIYQKTRTILSSIKNITVPDFIHSVIEYINENYSDHNLSANLMADKLSITPQHFSKIFNSCTGISFPDYVNNIRLEKAKELLSLDSKLSAVKISSLVGYNNSTYFTTSFTKKFGISPGKLKNSIKYESLQSSAEAHTLSS